MQGGFPAKFACGCSNGTGTYAIVLCRCWRIAISEGASGSGRTEFRNQQLSMPWWSGQKILTRHPESVNICVHVGNTPSSSGPCLVRMPSAQPAHSRSPTFEHQYPRYPKPRKRESYTEPTLSNMLPGCCTNSCLRVGHAEAFILARRAARGKSCTGHALVPSQDVVHFWEQD